MTEHESTRWYHTALVVTGAIILYALLDLVTSSAKIEAAFRAYPHQDTASPPCLGVVYARGVLSAADHEINDPTGTVTFTVGQTVVMKPRADPTSYYVSTLRGKYIDLVLRETEPRVVKRLGDR